VSGQRLRAALQRLAADDGYTARLAVANNLDPASATELCLAPLRLAVLRDMTIEPLVPALQAELARSGFMTEVRIGDFDTIGRDALTGGGPLEAFEPDAVVVLRWLDQTSPDLATRFITLEPAEVAAAIEDVITRVGTELAAIRRYTRAPILINTFPLPDVTTLGILDAQRETGHRRAIEDLNRGLLRMAQGLADVLVVDLARLVGRLGSRSAIDERSWHTSRAPLARPLVIALAAEIAKYVRAFTGRVRKCLVLDCDDTLWGGIVGEEGLAAIRLDTAYPGSGYLAFQREILNLRHRGVLLAIVSKNNEADVMEVLRDHPHMQIREEHLAAWRINWQDKASNLVEIAAELNIALDSLVFVDDSQFECDLVRARLPEVAVVQLGDDPSGYATALTEPGLFDSLAYSADDRARAGMYVADRQRSSRRQAAGSLEEYLADLAMVATIGRPTPLEIARVAQLTQKTNQFNLTTVRYTEGEIGRLVNDAATDVLALRLRDRFSDLGLVGVAILRHASDRTAIDTLLMSCRVLGRGVEDAFLAHVAAVAAGRGAAVLTGTYRPTAKNGQVEFFYRDRGFRPAGDNGAVWELDLTKETPVPPAWITIGGTTRE
jgi:FkbH-like protein